MQGQALYESQTSRQVRGGKDKMEETTCVSPGSWCVSLFPRRVSESKAVSGPESLPHSNGQDITTYLDRNYVCLVADRTPLLVLMTQDNQRES